MKIKSVRLNNFCQFRDYSVSFCDGVNFIVGRNGAGKSNLIHGIFFALTGELAFGTIQDNINYDWDQEAQPDEKSFVEVKLTHGNNNYTFKRYLKPSKFLVYKDGEFVTDRASVAKKILNEIFGVSTDIVNKHVFVLQNQMSSIFSVSATERLAFFQRLFNLDKIIEIGNVLSNIKLDFSGNRDLLLKLESDLKLLESDLLNKQTELYSFNSEFKNLELNLKEYMKYCESEQISGDFNFSVFWSDVFSNINDFIRLLNDKVSITSESELLKQEIDDINKNIENLNLVKQDLLNKKSFYDEAREKIIHYNRYALFRDEILEKESKLNSLQDELACEIKNKPVFYVDVEDPLFIERLNRFRIKESLYNTLNTTIKNQIGSHCSLTCCPICERPIDKEEFEKIFSNTFINSIKNEINNMVESKNISLNYNKKIHNINKEIDSLKMDINRLNKYLKDAGGLDVPTVSAEDVDRFYSSLSDVENKLKNFEIKLVSINAKYEKTEEQKIKIIDKIESIKEFLFRVFRQDCSENIPELENRKQKIKELISHYDKYKQCEFRLDSINNEIRKIKNEIEKKKRDINFLKATIKFGDLFYKIRNIFSKEFPAYSVSYFLDLIKLKINNVLRDFKSCFSVDFRSDSAIDVIFDNGRRISVDRLSVGQKILVSLAFRVVVSSLFTKDLGFICFDEPTAGLDLSNLSCFNESIFALQRLSCDRDFQIVIVTHEERLLPESGIFSEGFNQYKFNIIQL
jgi:DNA repair exonuclease SbcCD ATPase subunit